MNKKEIIKAVVGQIENMYENNIIHDYGTECFECWCEDGEVFRMTYDNAKEEDIKNMVDCMKFLAPCVDRLTQEIENYADNHFISTYYQPQLNTGDIPDELHSFQAFVTAEDADAFMKVNGYSADQYEIVEYHDDDIEDAYLYDADLNFIKEI